MNKYRGMKTVMSIMVVVLTTMSVIAREDAAKKGSPLGKFSDEWNDPKYKACNTAANTTYLSATEKEIVYVLNLARMNPQLFCKTVLPRVREITSFVDTANEYYYKSLVKQMSTMDPLPLLKPDAKCFASAQCHAASTGKTGFVGHGRQTAECRKVQYFRGECCQYGVDDPLGIIVNLLVDENVESLGHRDICLGSYTKMSPSYGEHKKYGSITVLDFDR